MGDIENHSSPIQKLPDDKQNTTKSTCPFLANGPCFRFYAKDGGGATSDLGLLFISIARRLGGPIDAKRCMSMGGLNARSLCVNKHSQLRLSEVPVAHGCIARVKPAEFGSWPRWIRCCPGKTFWVSSSRITHRQVVP